MGKEEIEHHPMKPVTYDLFCGLGGWAEGFRAEGYSVIGFEIERHDYGTGGYPSLLVLQDILTLHGSELKNATCIVANPPCQSYSWMAMPWSRAKQMAREYREGIRSTVELNALFNACFRIQREASEAAGRYIPMIVENVRGAQPWVGRSQWAFGSFHLWGDVPALMPMTARRQKFNPDGTAHPPGSWFAVADSKSRGSKTSGQNWSNFGKTGEVSPHWRMEGIKATPVNRCASTEEFGWAGTEMRQGNSHSSKRKAASAKIAKIPFPLAQHIAKCFYPSL